MSDKIKLKEVKVAGLEVSNETYTMSNFLDILKTFLEEIPDEFRNSASVRFSSAYASAYCELEVLYTRPLNEAETQMLAVQAQHLKERQDVLDKATYERLKAKFEPDDRK